ncbi:hypothetical protein TEA_016880 [Camellia sinensis var. sinensis]|uniref:Uncharacterized protein n=1 Tax=Camellia sinensis var. sinensis TaxID=542762 RepID=A0A4S4DDT4_CAMSN|nr:hypothetical protein TEA_016880 [Camellia sinensis var. sinensis]
MADQILAPNMADQIWLPNVVDQIWLPNVADQVLDSQHGGPNSGSPTWWTKFLDSLIWRTKFLAPQHGGPNFGSPTCGGPNYGSLIWWTKFLARQHGRPRVWLMVSIWDKFLRACAFWNVIKTTSSTYALELAHKFYCEFLFFWRLVWNAFADLDLGKPPHLVLIRKLCVVQAKKDEMEYKLQRIPFLEEQVRKVREGGKLLSMDIERLLLSEDNRFDFVNEVAAEAKQYVENNRDEYGGKKAILHVLSNRMNDAGFYRPEAYMEDDPYKPGPNYLREEL